jgi:molybdopterin-guanine dinucleotide biosynthesis protein A
MSLSRKPTIAAAILAGGHAARCAGCPKALLTLPDGSTILGRMIAEIASAGILRVAIVANDPEAYGRFGLPVVGDRRLGCGPLGGIEAALLHHRTEQDVLILPCDLPAITSTEIFTLCDTFAAGTVPVVFAETDGVWQPLCAVVSNDALGAVTAALDRGWTSPRRLWQDLGAVTVRFADPAPFFNVNTPEDFDRWLRDPRAAVRERTTARRRE